MEPVRVVLRAHGLTDQQWRVLRVLEASGAMEMTELARAACMYPANLTRLVKHMAQKGYLTRAPNPQDRRVQIVAISEIGSALIAQAAPVLAGMGAKVRDAYGREKLERLRELLLELIDVGGTAP